MFIYKILLKIGFNSAPFEIVSDIKCDVYTSFEALNTLVYIMLSSRFSCKLTHISICIDMIDISTQAPMHKLFFFMDVL